MKSAAPPAFELELLTSPHAKAPDSTDVIMLQVAYALLPLVAFSWLLFGWSALLVIGTATGACVLTEHLICLLNRKPTTVADYSALITGLLLGLTLPPGFPLWMTVVGSIVAVAVAKSLFGGLGFNIFNPALVGRAFLQAAFPVAITTWVPGFASGRFTGLIPSTLALPLMRPAPVADYIKQAAVDGFSGATPLSLLKFEHVPTSSLKLFAGMTAGSAGETCAILIILGGLYLAWRNMLNWRIPVGVLATVFVLSSLLYFLNSEKYPGPFFMLFSGGLMLGAVFMATDMVTSPTTPLGVWVFGFLVGALTLLIRIKGGLPEGVMYAILIGNAVTPLIDTLTQPRVFGTKRWKRAK